MVDAEEMEEGRVQVVEQEHRFASAAEANALMVTRQKPRTPAAVGQGSGTR